MPQPSRRVELTFYGLALFAGLEIVHVGPYAALWTIPAILLAAMLIAWAAESAQFFIAQGFALAILAWMQTLPEFAVEAVLAWKQQVPLLMANLTGALRLLTGLGWPMIYCTAAFFYRRKYKKPMRLILLDREHCIEVVGLLVPLLYALYIYFKASLSVWDGLVLTIIYALYLIILTKVAPQEEEGIADLELIPRTIVKSARPVRITAIAVLFLVGGALIYYIAEPFLASLLALAAMAGIPSFVFVQWVAPFVSEFPEKVTAFYWARTIDRAPMALMNMVSSNINQWTLLTAMLPVVYSWSVGSIVPIPLNSQQEIELLMTIAQSLIGMVFLINMELAWWEAAALFVLWAIQFSLSALGSSVHWYVTIVYFLWTGVEVIRMLMGHRKPRAFVLFLELMRG